MAGRTPEARVVPLAKLNIPQQDLVHPRSMSSGVLK